ncbi:DUF4232 domain-containing protein [Streptomyces sp. V4-01]|uniref:DUF4232 domain-containing protein n=1 Tax=Actinacidiphila polyblastidii TaxID=3110430 RepID=A0ABU7PM55_9ACTN|nr:DUF4232 domain-containing protein [Streptomyces sp. V4-01]
MYAKSALSSAAVLLAGAAVLTGCGDGSATSAGGSAPSPVAVPSSALPHTTAPTPAPAPTLSASASTPTASKRASAPAASAPPSGGGYATSDSYAWKHPCSSRQLSVHLVRRASAPTQRVIEVRNNGARSCGLSYYPHVVLWDAESATGGVTITPLVPDGLGGPPASALHAGRTAYAVVDLDPSGATKGTAAGVDAMNVLADGDHMSSRETVRFPLGAGAHALRPKLGLYEDTTPDAVASMESADIQP